MELNEEAILDEIIRIFRISGEGAAYSEEELAEILETQKFVDLYEEAKRSTDDKALKGFFKDMMREVLPRCSIMLHKKGLGASKVARILRTPNVFYPIRKFEQGFETVKFPGYEYSLNPDGSFKRRRIDPRQDPSKFVGTEGEGSPREAEIPNEKP